MIKLNDLQKEVRRLANQYPNAIYQSPNGFNGCYYNVGIVANGPDTEGCLLGQAIRNLEPEIFEAITADSDDIVSLICIMNEDFDNSEDEEGDIEKWLSIVQGQQDGGKTWSEAVKIADLNMEEVMGW